MPAFSDLNGDGHVYVVVGSFFGGLHLWLGAADGQSWTKVGQEDIGSILHTVNKALVEDSASAVMPTFADILLLSTDEAETASSPIPTKDELVVFSYRGPQALNPHYRVYDASLHGPILPGEQTKNEDTPAIFSMGHIVYWLAYGNNDTWVLGLVES